jgi:spore coat protein CotH
LHYRVKDLEKEKESLLKEATKDKEEDLKKYQNFLKKLKVIKEKSFIGKSCG